MAKRKNSWRNLIAISPLMKKGGVHEKSNKAKRASNKRQTQRVVSEWSGGSDNQGTFGSSPIASLWCPLGEYTQFKLK
ncbi:hypothetical protein [Spartinivicinus poritis]|uniref:Uncharacterized protein n=1 Tax=Spartinivicinus poritis TaxID=2994640 RepID=A0ABT5UHX7_9GAMM|nr:hypothetical protein [Spartinivicinus sp. A2-2]MDE1465965.1 hypothetical protein [Spartinivicinus sp. A2-2]